MIEWVILKKVDQIIRKNRIRTGRQERRRVRKSEKIGDEATRISMGP
jgi:hypothetical protein